jgi:hypothetical protein
MHRENIRDQHARPQTLGRENIFSNVMRISLRERRPGIQTTLLCGTIPIACLDPID